MFIDLLFLLVIVYGFYIGYSKGLFRVIVIILLMLFSTMVSMLLMPYVVELLYSAFEINNRLLPYWAFMFTLISFVLLIWIIYKSINIKNQNHTNYGNFYAGLFMAALLVFIYSGIIGFITDSKLIKTESINKHSTTYQFILKVENFGVNVLKYSLPFTAKFFESVKDSNKRLDSMDKSSNRK
jgi:hypothetical protein